MSCYVDTSALLALLCANDKNHASARQAWERLIVEKVNLVCGSQVLLETFSLVQSRLGLEAARAFHEDLLPLLAIDWIVASDYEKGAGAVLTAARKGLSLVDCISFEIMRRRGLKTVFTFDRHFQEQGFAGVP